MPVLVPSAAEQTEIADFLDKSCGFADSTSGRLEREIELLREYRTRLIADVVTGKLDVRTTAARLPDVSVIEPSESDAELDDEPEAEEAAV
jgi:type I restriction enzyme S subunit